MRAVHVTTQEEWDEVTKVMGYEWNKFSSWKKHKEDTCIVLGSVGYARMGFFYEIDSIIISFDQWKTEFNPESKTNVITYDDWKKRNEASKGLNAFAKEIHEGNVKRGFYENPPAFGTIIALIHSELSEALEADRKKYYGNLEYFEQRLKEVRESFQGSEEEFKPVYKQLYEEYLKDCVGGEFAGTFIRLMDACGYLNIDIDKYVKYELQYNATRPYKHGKKY